MATATEEKKSTLPNVPPPGCMFSTSPGGDKIVIRKPRGPGPWFRVKHGAYGSKLVKAATAEKAVEAFATEHNPLLAKDKAALASFAAACRVAEVTSTKE